MPFEGLRVLSLESRKAKDMESLILREGGVPFVAPSVKERALEDDDATAIQFIDDLERGRFDAVVFMTGVGLAFLRDTLGKHMKEERIGEALRRVTVISRGPKPVGILRALNVPIHVTIPEPNTWREIVTAVAARSERRIAVQEYGRANREMNAALAAIGAEVTPVALYRWELPEDLAPLEEAVRRLAAGEIDVVLFTSSIQFDHLMEIARRLGLEEAVRASLFASVATGSVGPVMTECLVANGCPPDIMPRHPKMWALVKAAADEALSVLADKRQRHGTPVSGTPA
jgi:uroporphyrinogen-III synthase